MDINSRKSGGYYTISNDVVFVFSRMKTEQDKDIADYKFYCFDGEPRFLYVSTGMSHHETARVNFMNLDWTQSAYERTDYKSSDSLPEKPECFDEMIGICRILAKDTPFLRVDLYEISRHIYFSEMTFYPCSGFMEFKNEDHDYEVGGFLNLSNL